MSGIASTANQTRSENINLRVSRAQKSLIDRAAHALGRNRSDFMLETACREAESVLLDRRYFKLKIVVLKLLSIPPPLAPARAELRPELGPCAAFCLDGE
jgi:uncharacterized protein (DUF1778 family)